MTRFIASRIAFSLLVIGIVHKFGLVSESAYSQELHYAIATGSSVGPCTSRLARAFRPSPLLKNPRREGLSREERVEALCNKNWQAWLKLSPEQKYDEMIRRRALVQQKISELGHRHAAEFTRMHIKLGLIEPIEPDLLGKEFAPPTTSWLGRIDGRLMEAAGSFHVDNPAQGIVFLMQEGAPETSQFFDTPSATGPVNIIGARDGVLTLRSLEGDYDARSAGDGLVLSRVHVVGGVTYHFNMKNRQFE